MTLSNDQIRAILQEFTAGDDQYTDGRLNEFAQTLMKTNDPIDQIDAIAPAVVREIIPMSWMPCVKELRTRTGCGLKEGKEAIERALVDYLRDQLAVFEGKMRWHAGNASNNVGDFNIDETAYVNAYGCRPNGNGLWTFVNEQGYHIKRVGIYQDVVNTLPTSQYKLAL